MKHPYNGNRRSLDGPIKRVPMAPIASAPASLAQTTSIPLAEEKVFVYNKNRRRLPWKLLFLVPIICIVLLVGWFGFKTLMATSRIITKSNGAGAPALNGKLDVATLKGEGDGRINILVMGIGGAGHDGPNLSDSMMVWSIDPKTKDVAVLSVPRDLYVKIPGYGYGKINAANSYGGPTLAEQVVSGVIGVPIHYYIVVDFSGFKQAVDAVGGVDINVLKTLNDPLYPCDSENGKYCPIYFSPGLQHMTGTLALRYSRSRETTSDFSRAARQQQVAVALRAKALAVSTLTNPIKLSGLIDTIGGHVKTDLQLNEIQKLAGIAKDIDATRISQKVLDTGSPDSLLQDGTGSIAGAGSIELPKAGTFNYSDIQDYVKNIFTDHYIVDENARIEVQNGSGILGLAATVVKSLLSAHYNVGDPVNAASQVTTTVIYDYTGGKKPYTINYLERRFGVKSIKASLPSPSPTPSTSAAAVAQPEIRIIIGSDYGKKTSSSTSQ
jgi:LCP family protein required for cell wall assembly